MFVKKIGEKKVKKFYSIIELEIVIFFEIDFWEIGKIILSFCFVFI